MNYDEILANLEKAGVEVNSKGFFKKGTKQQANDIANAILAVAGANKDMFLAEYNRRMQERIAKMAAEADNEREGSIVQDYQLMLIQHELLTEVDAVGEPDRKIFNKIKYATNPFDGSIILLVNMHDASWRAVPLSGSTVSDQIQLVTLCSQAEANHPKLFDNYYEEIIAYTTRPLRKIFSEYRAKKIKGTQQLALAILERVPHTLLQNSCVKALCQKKKITLSNDKEELIYVPKTAALYTSADSNEKYNPFTHLVKKAYSLAAIPEFQTNMPAIISNSATEPALHYIDLRAIRKEGPTPTWDEFAERFSPEDFKVLEAFIWSIFRAKNKGRQLLYIYDPDGFSGKSVLMSVLSRALGPDISASIQKDSLNNQFSLAKIWDKRLVTIDDNKNRNLIRSEKMHMILGGGWADIEMKGRNSFHAKLFTKMIAGGNVPLSIDPYAVHERSRLIMIRTRMNEEILKRFCQLDSEGNLVLKNGKPVMLGDPSFEENLLAEFPAFLTKCRAAYKELCPTDANIVLTDEQVDALFNLADDNDYIYDQVLELGYEIDESYTMTPFEFQEVFYKTRKLIMMKLGDKDLNVDFSLGNFKEYMVKRYPSIGVSRPRSKNARSRVMTGIRKRTEHEHFNPLTSRYGKLV